MSYVPPHLRKSVAATVTATATATTTTTTATPTNVDNITTNHKLNSKSNNNAFSNSTPRRSSANNHIQPSRALAVPNVVLPQWKPSERVLRLKPEQIEEVRLRLNVDVTVTPDSPAAPAPIESFTDMCLASSIMNHDIVSGKNPTAIKIIGPKSLFGTTVVIDDPLTIDTKPDSLVVGRAQGLYAMASQHDSGLLMTINFVFTYGKYNGSALSVMGRNRVFDVVREMPVVGGSGVFRFARGYALASTVRYNLKTGNAVVEYNVTVMHD